MPIAFRNADIIDAIGGAAHRGTVTVEDGRISAVNRAVAGGIDGDPNEAIDCKGLTLMPGLTEAHCHISFNNLTSMYQAIEIQPEDHSCSGRF